MNLLLTLPAQSSFARASRASRPRDWEWQQLSFLADTVNTCMHKLDRHTTSCEVKTVWHRHQHREQQSANDATRWADLAIQVALPENRPVEYDLPGVLIHPAYPGSYLDDRIGITPLGEPATQAARTGIAEEPAGPFAPEYHYGQFKPSRFLTSVIPASRDLSAGQNNIALLVIGNNYLEQIHRLVERCLAMEPRESQILVMVDSSDITHGWLDHDRVSLFQRRPCNEFLSLLRTASRAYFAGSPLHRDATRLDVPVVELEPDAGSHVGPHTLVCSNRQDEFLKKLLHMLQLQHPGFPANLAANADQRRVIGVPQTLAELHSGKKIGRRIDSGIRKLRKLRQSPWHFFADSKLVSQILENKPR